MADNSRSEQEHKEAKFIVDEDEQAANQALRARINELAAKQKSLKGLNEAEKLEQKQLRQQFLANFRKTFKSQVEMLQVFDENGKEVTPKKVIDVQKKERTTLNNELDMVCLNWFGYRFSRWYVDFPFYIEELSKEKSTYQRTNA